MFFARRTAFDQALGQRVAERRVELIERISAAVDDTLGIVDAMAGAPVATNKRDISEVFDEFMELDRYVHLYFSEDLNTAVSLFTI